MTELLKAFPAIWMVVGVIIASGAFLIGNRYIFRWQRAATENLVNTLQRQIDAGVVEKDDYKTKLHAERESHQACVLRIKELEMKPDVTALFQASQDFYQQQTKVQVQQAQMMEEMLAAVHKHDADATAQMKPIYDSLKLMGDGIAELLKRSAPKT